VEVPSTRNVDIIRLRKRDLIKTNDLVVTEEPLEMHVLYGPVGDRRRFNLAVTMRTPGDDENLLRGFLITEGIIRTHEDISAIVRTTGGPATHQSITAELNPDVVFSPDAQQRHFYTTSSCGVCGKASIDMVRQVSTFRTISGEPSLKAKVLCNMIDLFRDEQDVFSETGGIHAAGLFGANGSLLMISEDVGRHNAVDKLIGAASAKLGLPLNQYVMVVSGRAGFELVQKASVTGIAIFAAVGAPSSLAVELAEESAMTLVGFLKEFGMNIYSGSERIVFDDLDL